MPLAAVPSVEQVGETVVSEACDLAQHWQSQQVAEPDIPRGAPPDFDRAIGACVEPPFGIHTVETAPHILDPRTEARQGVRLQVDVAELDRTGACRLHEAPVLPFNAAVTDGAFGVVPDRELGVCHRGSPARTISAVQSGD